MGNKENLQNKSQNIDEVNKKDKKEKNAIKIIAAIMACVAGFGSVIAWRPSKSSVNIGNSTTISGTLDSVKDETELDENISKFLDEEQSLKSLDEAYLVCRKNKDTKGCNQYLYEMGDLILKAKIASCLNIEPSNIKEINYGKYEVTVSYIENNNDIAAGNIPINTSEIKTVKFETNGDLNNLIYNTIECSENNWRLKENLDKNDVYYNDKITIDDVYKSLQRAVLCSEEIKSSLFVDDKINSELNEDYISSYNEYIKNLKK